MKALYQTAEMDVIKFSMDDVIATSIATEPTTPTAIIPPTMDPDATPELDPIP